MQASRRSGRVLKSSGEYRGNDIGRERMGCRESLKKHTRKRRDRFEANAAFRTRLNYTGIYIIFQVICTVLLNYQPRFLVFVLLNQYVHPS